MLTGGRITAEDGYAYSKFARVALGTNDIDFRARPLSAEETSFLASEVVLRQGATYADLETAATVVLAGLEPEDEAGAIFLRLRKAHPAYAGHPRRLHRAVRLPRPPEARRPAGRDPPGREALALQDLLGHADHGIDTHRRDPRRRAAGHLARRAERRRRGGVQDRRQAGLGAAPGR